MMFSCQSAVARLRFQLVLVVVMTSLCLGQLDDQFYPHPYQIHQRIKDASNLRDWFSTEEGQKLVSDFHDRPANMMMMLKQALEKSPELISGAISNGNGSESQSQCINDTLQVFADLASFKPYALSFVDATTKVPSGILRGKLTWLGSYDQCMNITAQRNGEETSFKGRYCKVYMPLNVPLPLPTASVIQAGVCIPNTCNNYSAVAIVNAALSKLKLYAVYATCSEEAVWETGDFVTLSITGILVLVIVAATLYDLVKQRREQRAKERKGLVVGEGVEPNGTISLRQDDNLINTDINAHLVTNDLLQGPVIHSPTATLKKALSGALRAFSAYTNFNQLFGAKLREGGLSSLNGLRVLSMWWVILGHTHSFATQFADNMFDGIDFVSRFSFMAILNATFSVDSFFFLSGLLVTYLTLRQLSHNDGKLNWGLYYFHRFWRLTPAYMFTLLVYTYLFPHSFNGPFMVGDIKHTQGFEQCKKYWWTNLFYINNLYFSSLADQCMGWSWYLANDMQFFVISPIILFLLYRYKKIGLGLILFLIVGCLAGTAAIVNVYGLTPNILVRSTKHLDNPTADFIYSRPYTRIATYLVGMVTGYIFYATGCQLRIKKVYVAIGWALAIAINMATLYGEYSMYSHKRLKVWSTDVNALYMSCSRFAWSLGLAWMCFACVHGYGGPVNWVLSWKVWNPLGRLTYCAYLVHPMTIFMLYSNKKVHIHYDDISMVWIYFSNLVAAYAAALVLSLLLEAPMMGLEKVLLKRKSD